MAENSESFIYTQKHFELTEQELAKLDRFVRVNAAKFAAAGEQGDSVMVQFVFSSFGRDVLVSFSGGASVLLEDLP